MNFGGFATPERNIIFDINDFDETLPAPWEWDVKRLVASIVLAARSIGLSDGKGGDCAVTCARSYRKRMREFSEMDPLEALVRAHQRRGYPRDCCRKADAEDASGKRIDKAACRQRLGARFSQAGRRGRRADPHSRSAAADLSSGRGARARRSRRRSSRSSRLPGDAGGRPAHAARSLSARRCRHQGGRHRQRRAPMLDRPADVGGQRPAVPAVQGGGRSRCSSRMPAKARTAIMASAW